MNNYLSNLAARTLNQVEVIQPRLASIFEPLQNNPELATEQLSIDTEVVDNQSSLGLIPQEKVETKISMETQKPLSVHGEEVTIKPHRNQEISTKEETQAKIISSVTNKTFSQSEPEIHQPTRTPNTYQNLQLQPNVSSSLEILPNGIGKIPKFNTGSAPSASTEILSMPQLPTSNINSYEYSYEYRSDERESVNLPTPKNTHKLNTNSKFTNRTQAEINIHQPKDDSYTKHLAEFQPKKVSTNVLISKELPSNINDIDHLIPLTIKPAINMYPRVQVSSNIDTALTEQTPTPTINVTIGKIEVRATPSVAPETKQRPKPSVMGLDEYLHQRAKGDHR
ncbi:MAG: hypothetical protein IGS39_16385 [Calothrix sp. C42_A2020_038]|nr:hypothetical protein [Calothrix sp. C42_A2020_038]